MPERRKTKKRAQGKKKAKGERRAKKGGFGEIFFRMMYPITSIFHTQANCVV